MAVFEYQTVRSTGERCKGVIEASSLREAKTILREQQLLILSLKESVDPKQKGMKMSFEQQTIFTSQLSQLLEANVPLYESLEALEEQAKGESYQGLLSALREHIKKGSSFSAALSHYPETFSSFFRAMIVAGESVGRLDKALIRLSEQLRSQRQSKQRLISALLYPSVLALLLVASMIIMIFFVIPSLEALFEDRELPAFTTVVLSITHAIHTYLWPLLILGIGGLAFCIVSLRKQKVREQVVARFMRWPLLGPYLIKSSLARFSRTLSNLLFGGTPLSSALEHSREALCNPLLEKEVQYAAEKIIEGATFSSALSSSEHLPVLFSRMVTIGEETGRLAPILANLAQLYEEDSDRTLDRTVSLLQPFLLITMGILIGSMLFAVLLPIADFGSGLEM